MILSRRKEIVAGKLAIWVGGDEAVFQRLTTTGKVDPAKVRVFWTTPPFLDYVWVARKGLDPKLSRRGSRLTPSIQYLCQSAKFRIGHKANSWRLSPRLTTPRRPSKLPSTTSRRTGSTRSCS